MPPTSPLVALIRVIRIIRIVRIARTVRFAAIIQKTLTLHDSIHRGKWGANPSALARRRP
ncbi:hypothetical protein GCM10028832_45570 [Streptomyces sparsus]